MNNPTLQPNLEELFKTYQPKDLLFLVPMRSIRQILFIRYTSSDDPEVLVPCRITEKFYKVKDNYKVELEAIDEYKEVFGSEKFYISDLNNLIKEGIVQAFVQVKIQ